LSSGTASLGNNGQKPRTAFNFTLLADMDMTLAERNIKTRAAAALEIVFLSKMLRSPIATDAKTGMLKAVRISGN
jgi:hypothetical protein